MPKHLLPTLVASLLTIFLLAAEKALWPTVPATDLVGPTAAVALLVTFAAASLLKKRRDAREKDQDDEPGDATRRDSRKGKTS